MIGIEWKRGTAVLPCDKATMLRALRAMDTQTTIGKVRSCQREMNRMTEGSPMWKEKKTEQGRLKAALPGFIFMARGFDEHEWVDTKGKSHGTAAWRHQEHVRINGLFLLDIDHVQDPQQLWQRIATEHDIKALGIVFAFITPSGEGLKIVAKTDAERGNIADHQKWLANEIGVEEDEACKDASRLSFCSLESDVLYLSDELFTYENKEFIEKYEVQYRGGHTEATLDFAADEHGLILTKNNLAADEHGLIRTKDGQEKNKVCESPCKSDANNSPSQSVESDAKIYSDSWKGIKYAHIVREWEAIYRKGKEAKDVKRHFMVLGLSKDLRHVDVTEVGHVKQILESVSWYQDLMNEGRNEDNTIADGLKAKMPEEMPKRMKDAIAAAKAAARAAGELPRSKNVNDVLPLEAWGHDIEKLMDYFPCLREACYDKPAGQYPAILFVTGALYGTLMTRTWYHYWYEPWVTRRLNYAVYVIGDPASGKSFANNLYKVIMEPIAMADAIGNEAINKYKKARKERDTSTKEQRKEALKEPEVKIRIHGARTANGEFIKDMVANSEIVDGRQLHLHLFTFDSELDNAKLNSGQGWCDKSVFELKAFHNEEDSQSYKNMDSVNGPFDVFWNFVYTGTPLSLRKKVNSRNFGSGLSTRLACIPMPDTGYTSAEMTTQSKALETAIATLRQWAYEAEKVHGELPVKELNKCTFEWFKTKMAQAELNDSKVTEMLSMRVPYYGINISMPFIIMRHWKEWQETGTIKMDKKDQQLCKLVLDIQYQCQLYFFGKYAKDYRLEIESAVENPYREDNGKLNMIYSGLPEIFGIADIEKQEGYKRSTAYNVAKILVELGLATSLGSRKAKWRKTTTKD